MRNGALGLPGGVGGAQGEARVVVPQRGGDRFELLLQYSCKKKQTAQ